MRYINILILLILFAAGAQAQKSYTVSGIITDERGEPLIGATIYDTKSKMGIVTNEYGFYSLTLPPGNYEIASSYLGYEIKNSVVKLNDDHKLNVKLIPESTQIDEVQVLANGKKANVDRIDMSTERLPIKTIKKLPVLMGETDIIKTIQLLPGVQTVGEGTSGFYVRGGGVDQNLILLDEATVYNPSHLGGFFSVFNGDAIKNVELYKGGISAKYGGRLSSVLDIRMKEGSTDKIHANGGLGIISSRLTVEGPIVNNNYSFIVSGRRTYFDLFFPISNNEAVKESKGYFYDLNAKVTAKINDKNRVYFSGYLGNDVYGFSNIFEMQYGNKTATLRWNHVMSDKLFINITAIHSEFDYRLGVPGGTFNFDWKADIDNNNFKIDNTYYLNPQNTIRFGGGVTQYTIIPGVVNTSSSSLNSLNLPLSYAMEYFAYTENQHKINPWISVQYGLRYTLFNNTGATVYDYDAEYQPIDSIVYKRGNSFNTYQGLTPRAGIRVKLNNNNAIKASYNRMYQFIHLATNTAATTPVDVWFLSNPNIKPQYSDQVVLGYFRNLFDDQLEISTEAYYKKMYNAIDFVDHAELLLNEHFDGELRFGEGYSYGLELMAKKQQGDFTGWVSYTWSKTRRKIKEINNGMEYPAPYDKPHDLKIVASYQILNRLNIGASWVYSSAMPLTVVKEWYQINNFWVPEYSERNAVRLKGTDYHRLDLSLTYDLKPKRRGNYEHSLMASVYNVYNRHNLYSIQYVSAEGSDGPPEMQKMYLFTVIPTITYNFKF